MMLRIRHLERNLELRNLRRRYKKYVMLVMRASMNCGRLFVPFLGQAFYLGEK